MHIKNTDFMPLQYVLKYVFKILIKIGPAGLATTTLTRFLVQNMILVDPSSVEFFKERLNKKTRKSSN